MIPKIIHTFWGGNKNLYDNSCVRNWEEILKPAGYEINIMTHEDIDLSECEWVEYTYKNKKWAHLSDYYRFWLANKYGGFWFDTDILVHKPFDELHNLDYAMSKARHNNIKNRLDYIDPYKDRDTAGFMCLSLFGMEKNHKLSQIGLDWYKTLTGFEEKGFDIFEQIIGRVYWNALHMGGNIEVDYTTYIDFDDNQKIPIDDIQKTIKENPNKIITLPAITFDMYDRIKLYEHQFASHLHYGSWMRGF